MCVLKMFRLEREIIAIVTACIKEIKHVKNIVVLMNHITWPN